MKKISFVLIIEILFLCTGTAWDFSPHQTSAERTFIGTETTVGNAITVTLKFTNNETNEIHGFYFTEHIPIGLSVRTESVTINGKAITNYTAETGTEGDVYTNYIPFRWILETPPLFDENHPITPSNTLEIQYSVSSPSVGTFVFDRFSWAGTYQLSSNQRQAAFGHSDDSDRQTIKFVKSISTILAEDDEYTIKKGETLILPAPGVLTNDTATGSPTLTAVLDTDVQSGTLNLNRDGSFNYSHDGSKTDSDKFTYHATDGSANSGEATVSIKIYTVTLPPAARNDEATTTTDIPLTIDVCCNDTDPDGTIDPESITIIAPPSHGTAQVNGDGTVTYIPNTGFTGKDTFSYTVKNDRELVSNEAMVSISVNKESEAEKKDDGGGGSCFLNTIR